MCDYIIKAILRNVRCDVIFGHPLLGVGEFICQNTDFVNSEIQTPTHQILELGNSGGLGTIRYVANRITITITI